MAGRKAPVKAQHPKPIDEGVATDVALPFDTSAEQRPPPFTYTLTNGTVVEWRMPDPFALVAFNGFNPDPITTAVIHLLNEEKHARAESDPRKFIKDREAIKGMYGLIGHMLENPRFDPRREYGDGREVLGRRDIGYHDVIQLYWAFRLSPLATFSAPTGADDAGGVADAAPDGESVRQNAG